MTRYVVKTDKVTGVFKSVDRHDYEDYLSFPVEYVGEHWNMRYAFVLASSKEEAKYIGLTLLKSIKNYTINNRLVLKRIVPVSVPV